jgi:hypothetical protein
VPLSLARAFLPDHGKLYREDVLEMQVVIREYGGSIICAVCLVFLMAFLFLHFGAGKTKGLMGVLGNAAVLPEEVHAMESYQSSEKVIESGSPRIVAPENIYAGDTIRDASEAFSKSSGNTLNVRVLQIFDPDGVRMTSSILTFPREGIYRIRLWAEDEKGHAGTEEVYVGVRP